MSNELALDDLFNDLPQAPQSDWDFLLCETQQPSPVFRMQERDERKGPQPLLTEGDRISYARIVVRVGYEFGVHSVTRREWWQTGLEIVAKDTGLPIEQVKAVVVALNHGAPFKGIKDKIYKAKVQPLINKSTLPDIRAMWFHDYEKPRTGQICGIVTRLTGKRDHGGSGYDGEDWDPPALYASHKQRLYKVISDYDRTFFHIDDDREVMVYPEDATQVTK